MYIIRFIIYIPLIFWLVTVAPLNAQSGQGTATANSFIAGLTKKAEKGDVESQKMLAIMYENGLEGAPKDLNMAFKWTLAAANLGDRNSMFTVAATYEKSMKTDADKKAVAAWYKKIARADFSKEDTAAALKKIKAITANVKEPKEKAKAVAIVSQNNDSKTQTAADDNAAKAQALYEKGMSMGLNYEAAKVLDEAANLGHPTAASKARSIRAYLTS